MSSHFRRVATRLAPLALAAALAGCASTAADDSFRQVQDASRTALGAELKWLTSDEARRQALIDTDSLLLAPLSADGAVRIALAYSPALQAMLYDSAAEASRIGQSSRLPNPVFAFERLARGDAGLRELEIGRMLSVSVLDLLLLPARLERAGHQQETRRLELATTVVQAAADARLAWVRAVAAQQTLQYAEQVHELADASTELARRMQAAGNFSALQRAREQAFSADAVTQLARARQAARASREGLVRTLGLTTQQSAELRLPDRLPDLPDRPMDEAAVLQAGLDQRLDVQLARSNLALLARQQGIARVTGLAEGVELGALYNSESGQAPQKGFSLSVPLPIFDAGNGARSEALAAYMAAVNRATQRSLAAQSELREGHGAYRTAYDLARHYRDEVVPLRKAIARENLLRYNGMLIGVFELLADAREQVASVTQAIDAQRDFWLADAALQAALVGSPIAGPLLATPQPSRGAPPAAH